MAPSHALSQGPGVTTHPHQHVPAGWSDALISVQQYVLKHLRNVMLPTLNIVVKRRRAAGPALDAAE